MDWRARDTKNTCINVIARLYLLYCRKKGEEADGQHDFNHSV